MMIPKIVFKPMSLEENIEIVAWALSEDNDKLDVYKYTIDYYPELANIDDKNKEKIVKEVVTKVYKDNYRKIQNDVNRYNQVWKKYNDNYFKVLSEYLNISWPEKYPIIEASVGLVSVFAKNLEDFSFVLSTNLSNEKVIETAAHETCHFLWFEKWHELYPKCPKKEYNPPYLPWEYSEIVVDPILNSKEFSPLFHNVFIERAYDSFYKIKYRGRFVMDVLKEIYATLDTIETKIKKGYEYYQEALNDLSEIN